MIKTKLLILFVLFQHIAFAQVSLDSLLKKVTANSPVSKNKEIYKEIKSSSDKQISASYLPSLSFDAKATYQSDVTSLNIEGSPFSLPELPHDAYDAHINFSQMIWDGGIVSKTKGINHTDEKINSLEIDIQNHALKMQLTELFFAFINSKNIEKQLLLGIATIDSSIIQLESAYKNGVLKRQDIDVLEIEKLNLEQEIIDIRYKQEQIISSINTLTNESFTINVVFELPKDVSFPASINNHRAEYILFQLKQEKIDQNIELVSRLNYPKLGAFSRGGYGRPGLNMLSTEFEPYYVVGASISWQLWDGNRNKHKKTELLLQKEIINNQLLAFEQNLSIQQSEFYLDIQKYNELILLDERIIAKQEALNRAYLSQLKNGTITSSEYVKAINEELLSKIKKDIHETSKIKSIVLYQLIYGNL